MVRGCLWNSFVMVGHVQAFLNLIRYTLPVLSVGNRDIGPSLLRIARLTNFSLDVLSARTGNLAVLCGTGLGWNDLGEPNRVLSVLERKGCHMQWRLTRGTPEEWDDAAAAAIRLR